MTREDRFNALPYSKRVGKMFRIFVPLAVAYGICAALELDSLAGIIFVALWIVGFGTIAVLCGGRLVSEDESSMSIGGGPIYSNPHMWHRRNE